MKKAWVIVLTVLGFVGCAPVENIKQETTLFLKESDYSAMYKASPRTERTGMNIYGGYGCKEFRFVMEKPYGIKIIDKFEGSPFQVEIKNILTGETGCVMIGHLTKMTPNEIKVLNQEIKKAEKIEEQKELRQLQGIFKLSGAIAQVLYPCPQGGAHDTVNYLGVEPMGGGEYRKHYKCSKCGRKYTTPGKF